jgi:hypothetical protein
MSLHPFATGEERGLDALRPEKIDDAAVIARDVATGLAQIEGQRDELLPRRQFDPSDRATLVVRV